MAGYDVADVAELDAEGPGGVVRKVRRSVGARAFGPRLRRDGLAETGTPT